MGIKTEQTELALREKPVVKPITITRSPEAIAAFVDSLEQMRLRGIKIFVRSWEISGTQGTT